MDIVQRFIWHTWVNLVNEHQSEMLLNALDLRLIQPGLQRRIQGRDFEIALYPEAKISAGHDRNSLSAA